MLSPLRRILSSLALFATLAVTLMPSAIRATPADTDMTAAHLRIGVFNQTLTALAAQHKGFLAEQNLTVEYFQVVNSTQQFQYLRDGLYDMIHSAPDNTLNYRLNENNALGGAFDVQAFLGLDWGQNLSLVVRPGITSIADLKGKVIAVDSPVSGFAYVLYEMLRRHGLEPNVDYEVAVVGGNPIRYRQLLEGRFDATLLNAGFETRAANAGYPILLSVQDILSPYLGSVASARQGWLEENHDVVVRFIKAYVKANEWVFNPANRDEAIELLITKRNFTPELAVQMYELQVRPGVGIIPSLDMDREGLLTNLELRETWGGFEKPQNLEFLASPASGLYDEGYYREALAGLRAGQ